MLTTYFKIIRTALLSNRKKGEDIYYESHHIIPQSFNKKSSEVLLTAIEHYRVHRILAEEFKSHPEYGQKMLWAFHRMTYDGKRKLTEQEYSEAREILMPMWKRPKKSKWKLEMSEKMKGNKNGVGGKKDWIPTDEQRKNMSKAAKLSKLGKVGEESRASKGAVICENLLTGEKIEAGSALQLSKQFDNIHHSVINEILNSKNNLDYKPRSKSSKYYEFIQTHKIYYKQ
jgi:hypothetical protein